MDVGTLTATLALNDSGFQAGIKSANDALATTTTAANSASVAVNNAATGLDKMAGSSSRASAGARNLFHQLKDMAAGLASGMDPMMVLTQQGPQIADAFEMGGGAAETLGAALSGLVGPVGFVAVGLAEIAAAAGLAYGAYLSLNEEARTQQQVLAEQSAAFERLTPLIDDTARAELDLAVATGEISKAMADLQKASIKAFGDYNKATADTKAKLSALNEQQASVTTQLIDAAEYMMPAWSPFGAAIRGLTDDSADLQQQIDGQTASMQVAVGVLAQNHDAHTDLALAVQGEKDARDAATHAASKHASASNTAAQKAREEAAATAEAAKALREYVALYEQAAEAVYAKKSNPAAEFQKDFEAGISAFMPKFEISVSGKLDAAEADLAIALSRGVIDQELYNDDLKQIAVARLKIEQDYNDAQKAATAKMVAGIADQAVGIVKGMGKFGQLVSAAQEGAKAGGEGGAVVAVVGQLLAWNQKFQEAITGLDGMIQSVVGALDGLVAGLAPLMRAVGMIVEAVVGGLAPMFTAIGNVLIMLTPILSVVASLFTNLSGAFSIIAGVLTAVSPILYVAFDVIDTVLRGIAIVILSVMYGIETAWNAVIDVVADVLKALGADDAAKTLRNQKADAAGTLKQINDLIATSYEDAVKNATGAQFDYQHGDSGFHANKGINTMSDAATGAAEALDGLTQSLSNVPTGFKLNQYIYDAAQGMNRAPGASASGGGTNVYINEVHIAEATDIASLTAEVMRITKKKTVYGRYTPTTLPSRFGQP